MTIRTKILATIGPASGSETTLKQMVKAGMDAARLNFSHGDHVSHGEIIQRIRKVEGKLGRPVAIHADLGGPKIRIGRLPHGLPIQLKAGEEIVFAPDKKAGSGEIPVTFPHLARDLKKGNKILIDDGHIAVEVRSVAGDRIRAVVIDGGRLREHKGINLPGITLCTSAITKKDEEDLKFALSKKIDFVGVSFVQGPHDIHSVRKIMEGVGLVIPIVAKIERQTALGNLGEIMEEADATMIARGDLGVETPLEDVPVTQKRIVAKGFNLRRPVIVATQMLESMIKEARPTRAEVSDVANSVFDGADVVMLSAETSVGRDPAGAVAMMGRIIEASEQSKYVHRETYELDTADDSAAIATTRAACFAAEEAGAAAICVFTMTGRSALLISKQRPRAGIIAIVHSDEVARRVSLYWGVRALKIRKWQTIDTMIDRGIDALKSAHLIKKGQKVVLVCGTASVPGATNMIKVHEIGGHDT